MISTLRRVLLAVLFSAGLVCTLTAQSGTQSARPPAEAKGRIDLNSANPDALKALPGIGEANARKIVEGRPYRTPDQLVSKGILSKSAYEGIKDLVIAKNPWRP
ncbi:MAG TPA: helix-hairpin-helix domain-containing protein [Candidatus Sulfopaludibacter sp.]|jgi:DNA uptake protein ComE-like DNA-binding protein|nr:helix-hairpin-helix domain-containing protein [Candidatus Sulfopaludibacter sp.]